MEINNGTSERTMQERYLQRINGLGKCLMLWASQYSEFGSSAPWYYTEPNADNLMLLMHEMAELASEVDEEYVQFWVQMKLILLKVR